ncbi:4-aminobutyrate aminotransferase apoenzyme [Anaerovirgula multivorans]|uniref:(S)-3-amino-2-methylpropionate transaminase n=1 Tax=Anaerovirgula multivorans TaxID=312168 RepID=A0A239IZW7_9FIRM|nr:4-aminobutyrate--2-oxoglutarate transaminase [Anaerovirgula multivorans]SNS98563.1 4-aminobutyrate aminotransferase apoenzyme [Anaerovirgula multivorans]
MECVVEKVIIGEIPARKIITKRVPGNKSLEWIQKRQQYVAKGVGNITPVVAKTAKGALIEDLDGNVFLDFAVGIGMQNIGHGHDAVIKAVQEQVESLVHPCFHVTMYEGYIKLAEELAKKAPGTGEKKAMLANSGAEAVENAIKIARKYTGKPGIISLECAFHGRTYMAMTLTSKVKPYKNGFGPYASETYKIPSAYCYRCPYGGAENCNMGCLEKVKNLLKGELSPENIAALIVEPIQGEGGFIPQPSAFLKGLEKICKENNIVFIVDEIQSGFARAGTLFASEGCGLDPDLMTLSKSLGGGIPISAVVGKTEIMDAPAAGEIGGTYGGSPLGCEAALAVLKVIETENILAKAESIGKQLKKRLQSMQDRFEVIGDVRGVGAMYAIEFVKNKKTKEPYPEIIKRITEYALQKGVIFINAGIYSNVLRFLPPLVMTEEQVEDGMNVLEKAIERSL